jgi:DNA-directed RNA polymerase specialized sigma24 family protein
VARFLRGGRLFSGRNDIQVLTGPSRPHFGGCRRTIAASWWDPVQLDCGASRSSLSPFESGSLMPETTTPTLFPNTNWSMVARAGHVRSSVRRRTLEALLRQYLPALRAYLVARWRGPNPDRIDDVLQGFLAGKVLEQQILRRADQARGRFRTFLLTALDRYLVDEFRKDSAAKRSPGEAVASLGSVAEADHPPQEAADLFDLEWARQAVSLALGRMRRECEAGGRAPVWAVFEARVVACAFDGAEPMPYAQLVQRFGFASPEQAANVLITGKRMFARNLREVVGEYAEDDADAAEEVLRLKRILAEARA